MYWVSPVLQSREYEAVATALNRPSLIGDSELQQCLWAFANVCLGAGSLTDSEIDQISDRALKEFNNAPVNCKLIANCAAIAT
jgi:hypothetical protein